MISLELRSKELEKALHKLAVAGNVEYGQVIKEEGRYVTQTLIKFTPPKNLQQGRAAVAGDMSRLSLGLNYDYFKSRENEGGFYRSIARYIKSRDVEKMRRLLSNPNLHQFYGLQLMANAQELQDKHKQLRNRYGRITSNTNYASFQADYRKVLRTIQSRVGWTVAGWIPAAKATGAKYKKFADRFQGKAGAQLSHFGRNPFIIAKNFNVKIPNYQKDVDAVLRGRIGVTLMKLERVKAGKAVNLGFVRVRGGRPVASSRPPAI